MKFIINMNDCGYGANRMGITCGYKTIKEFKKELADKINYVDYKVAPIDDKEPAKYYQTVYNASKSIYDANLAVYKDGNFPITLGGDHSLALGSVKAALEVYGNEIGLIWIDAHADINTFEQSDTKNIHGTPVASLLGINEQKFDNLGNEIRLNPENLVYIGTRSVDYEEEINIAKYDICELSDSLIKATSFDEQKDNLIHYLDGKVKKVFISLDLDSMDPTLISAVSTDVTGGLLPDDVIKLIKEVNDKFEIIGLDVFEYNPLNDKNFETLNFVDKFLKEIEAILSK